jgi:hypothetical protein
MPHVAKPLCTNTLTTSMQSDRQSYNLDISPVEQFWVDQQPFLLAHGYQLRLRYDPAWVPSWKQSSEKAVKDYEAKDATRIWVRGMNLSLLKGIAPNNATCWFLETKCAMEPLT